MATTPLRAIRISDEIWKGAQLEAHEAGETLTDVIRRALEAYVQEARWQRHRLEDRAEQ